MQAKMQTIANRASISSRPVLARRTIVTKALKIGDTLPDFTVQTDTGAMISSKDMVKDSGAIVFFYPKANTSGCTNQACGFMDNRSTFEAAGFKIYGMSADKPEAQAAWKEMHGYPYPLLCDPSFEVLNKLGVTKENGTKVNRSHIIVEKGGVVRDMKIGIAATDSVPEALKAVL